MNLRQILNLPKICHQPCYCTPSVPSKSGFHYHSIFPVIYSDQILDFMKNNILLLSFISCLLLVSCGKKTPTPDPVNPPTGDVTLQTASSIKIGCAVDPNLLKNNALYKGVVIKEYNSVTAENAMKWGSIHPSQTTYNFTDADYIADFCATNNKRLFGHNLLWHAYNPTWLENFSGDSTAFENLMKTHIQTVVGR